MADKQRGSLTIEDDVIVKTNNNNDEKSRVHCHLIHVFIAVLIVLIILALVGVLTYFLPNRQCITNNGMSPTLQSKLKTESVPRYRGDGSDYTTSIFPTAETSEWSSDGSGTQPVSSDGPWEGRLPRSVLPSHYNLTIQPYFYPEDLTGDRQRFTFDGKVYITVTCEDSTNQITLHISAMNITTLLVYSDEMEKEDLVEDFEEDPIYEFLKIYLKEDLAVGAMYVIEIEYIGLLQDEPLGFYKTMFRDENENERWGGVTTMQPTAARLATPCFDEPDFKAEFDVTIRHRSDMTALSNGIELSITDLGGSNAGWKETVFKTTPLMSTYLLAFTVNHFVQRNTTTGNGTLIRVWCKPQDIEYAQYALESGVKHTTFFESYFEIAFPLEKQDMVAVPNFIALAMENWGLIVYHESAMIYNPDRDSVYVKERVAMIVSHEIAHQWFGNLVTPLWWDDLWLNEGFARYTEYLGVDYSEPQWNVREEIFLESNFKRAMHQDSSADSHPVREQVNTPDEIFSIFDSITYDKGATVIRMLVNMLGEDVFIAGLRDYLKMYTYKNTVTEDLWAALTKADVAHGGNDVKAIMDTWTLQPFYPLVTFNRTSVNSVQMSQRIYFRTDEAKERYEELRPRFGNLTWEIQISHTHQSEAEFSSPTKEWLHSTRAGEITLSTGAERSDWYLVNIGCYGYYRINYDADNWNRLTQQLLYNHKVFPVQNRFQILDDAVTLFESGDMNIQTLLTITSYLQKEDDYLPWSAAIYIAEMLRSVLKMQPVYGLLEKYCLQLLTTVFDSLGGINAMVNYPDNPRTLKHSFQIMQAACFFRDERCLETTRELYSQYMDNPSNNPVPATNEMRRFQYCYAILQGGLKEWEFALEQYLALTQDRRESDNHWLYGLCCSRQPWLLNRLLQDAYYGKLMRYKAFNLVVQYMASHDVGLPVVWNYIQQHWEVMWNDYDNDVTYSSLILDISNKMYSETHLRQLIEFGEVNDLLSGSYVDMMHKKAVKKLERIVKRRTENTFPATIWLDQHINGR